MKFFIAVVLAVTLTATPLAEMQEKEIPQVVLPKREEEEE